MIRGSPQICLSHQTHIPRPGSYSENRKGSCWTNPVCRSQARWQHVPCSIPFLHVCLCRNTWNWIEKCWDWSLHGTICYRWNIVSWQRQAQRTSSQRLPFTRAHSSRILQCLYVDEEAFIFASRTDLKKSLTLIHKHFEQLGLEMHIGRGENPSKTECVFFPPWFFLPHAC